MKNNIPILLIEDDMALALSLKDYFEDNGLETTHVSDGGKATTTFINGKFELILLDIMLPNKNGFEIIKEIREINTKIPVILMTGTELDSDKIVKGYELGAINYLRKPILPQVVLSLTKTLISGQKKNNSDRHKVEIRDQHLYVDQKKIKLREKDAQVLDVLLSQKNTLVSRSTILNSVWKDDSYMKNNILDSCISRLRKELEIFPHLKISSIYGTGYMFEINNEKNS